MRAVVQRVSAASVETEGKLIAEIGVGLLLLVGIHRDDDSTDALKLADRVVGARIFNDPGGRINLALKAVDGEVLAVSNFTVYGDASQRRPSFTMSAPYERGRELFEEFVSAVRNLGVTVKTGEFGAEMSVAICNQGPVTLIMDTR
jgi:D-tyrosyl-tRNA(Tyr) deacylase